MDWLKKLLGGSGGGSAVSGLPSFFSVNSPGINNRKLLESYTRWIYVCVDRISQATADVPVKLMRQTEDGVEEVEDHEALKLLHKPNGFMTGRMLRYIVAAHTEIAGDAYIRILDEENIIPLIPDDIKVVTNKSNTEIVRYEFKKEGRNQKIDADDILHYRYPNPKDITSGLGVVEPIAKWVDVDTLMTDFNKKFFENGAWLGGMIESEATDEQQLELIRQGFDNEHRGATKAHKVGILPSGAKWIPNEMNPKDMEFSEGDKRFRDKILAAFGVPKAVLGMVEDVNRSNAEASHFVFNEYTVKPKVKQFVDFLNEQYLDLYDDDELFFDFDDPTPENKEVKIQENKAALGGQPWKTVNEVREEQGLPPVEGGDELVREGTPVGEPEDREVDTSPKRSAHFTSGDDLKDDVREAVKEMTREEELERRHKQFINRVDPFEREIITGLQEQADEIFQEVVNNIVTGFKDVDKASIYIKDEAVETTIDIVTPILERLGEEEGAAVMQGLSGVSDQFDPSNERWRRALDESIEKMSDTYHETTLDKLKKTLDEGLEAGEPQDELIDRVSNTFDEIDTHRAERIARSETFRTANRARWEAYQQSGVVKTIRWYTALDERVCPFCRPMNGEVISTESKFFEAGDTIQGQVDEGPAPTMTADYGDVRHPPLHPSCRCYIVPEEISVRSNEDDEVYEMIIETLENE